METNATDEAPIGNPGIFRYTREGETIFYPPYLPWRPFIVESDEEKARLSSEWAFTQFLLLVSIAVVGTAYLALKIAYTLPEISLLAMAPIVYAMYLLFTWGKFRSEYSSTRKRAPKLSFFEYNRQTAETMSVSQLKLQVYLSLVSVLALIWLKPDDAGSCVMTTIFTLLLAYNAVLLGLKFGKEPPVSD